jgi:hypothetical protein
MDVNPFIPRRAEPPSGKRPLLRTPFKIIAIALALVFGISANCTFAEIWIAMNTGTFR